MKQSGFMLAEVVIIMSVMLMSTFALIQMISDSDKSTRLKKGLVEVDYIYKNVKAFSTNIDALNYSFSKTRNTKMRDCIPAKNPPYSPPNHFANCNYYAASPTEKYEEFNLYDPSSGKVIAGTHSAPAKYNGKGQLCNPSSSEYQNCKIRVYAEMRIFSCNPPSCTTKGAEKIGIFISINSNDEKVPEFGIKIIEQNNKQITPGTASSPIIILTSELDVN